MLASITPLGERGRNQRWPVTVGFYLLGSLVGGAALGTAAGLAGSALRRVAHLSDTATLLVVALAALGALLLDLSRSGRIPSLRRQVNEDWLVAYRNWVYAMGFGLQLGAGVATVVTTASTYLVVVAALAPQSLGPAVAIGCTYGLARALPILFTARVATFPQLAQLHQRMSSWLGSARRLTLATELAVAVVATGAALTR